MGQLYGGACESESYAEKDGSAPGGMTALGSDEGDEGAENQSCEKATDVCCIIGDTVRSEEIGQESPGQVEGDKYKEASERTGQRGSRHRKLTQLESRDERAGESEDGAGCADAQNLNVPDHAGETGAETADEIKNSKGPAAV